MNKIVALAWPMILGLLAIGCGKEKSESPLDGKQGAGTQLQEPKPSGIVQAATNAGPATGDSPKDKTDLKVAVRSAYIPLDLSNVMTGSSTKLFNGEKLDHLDFQRWGRQDLLGIPFTVLDHNEGTTKNVVQLYSQSGKIAKTMPRSISVPCGEKATAVHILGGIAVWGFPTTKANSLSMVVRLNYEGGQREETKLTNGVEIFDWAKGKDAPNRIALANGMARIISISPKSSKIIKTIDFVKGTDLTSPLVFAVTLEQRPEQVAQAKGPMPQQPRPVEEEKTPEKRGTRDPLLAAFLATESAKYTTGGFNGYQFGMSQSEVEKSTTFDEEVYGKTTMDRNEHGKPRLGSSLASTADALYRDPPYFREWFINSNKGEQYLFVNGKLVGVTKAFVGDVQGNMTPLLDMSGKSTEICAFVAKDESVNFGVKYFALFTTIDQYYVFPKVVVAISLTQSKKTENGKEAPQVDPRARVQVCVFDRRFFENSVEEMLVAHRKSLSALRKRADDKTARFDEWLHIDTGFVGGIKPDAITSSIFESLTTRMRKELVMQEFPPLRSGVQQPAVREPEGNAAKIGRYITSYYWKTSDGCNVKVGSKFVNLAR